MNEKWNISPPLKPRPEHSFRVLVLFWFVFWLFFLIITSFWIFNAIFVISIKMLNLTSFKKLCTNSKTQIKYESQQEFLWRISDLQCRKMSNFLVWIQQNWSCAEDSRTKSKRRSPYGCHTRLSCTHDVLNELWWQGQFTRCNFSSKKKTQKPLNMA